MILCPSVHDDLSAGVQSWYWECDFGDAELQAAYDAMGTATTAEEVRRAFLVLLRSEDTVARGIALDFFDPAAIDDRALAVTALFDVPGPSVTAVLLRVAHSDVLPIQVEGALGLTCDHLIDRHRDLVRGLAESWPGGDDEPDRAWLVHDALED